MCVFVLQELNVTSEVKKVGVQVTDLSPYTKYTFNVTCIPGDLKGFWSRHTLTAANTSISGEHKAQSMHNQRSTKGPPRGYQGNTKASPRGHLASTKGSTRGPPRVHLGAT